MLTPFNGKAAKLKPQSGYAIVKRRWQAGDRIDLTLPMTEITAVTGGEAHPFYAWVRDQTGFVPGWNFNKVLIGPEGEFVKAWGSTTKPDARPITSAIDSLLTQ